MKKISVRDHGLVGTLFQKGNPSSAIIVLGGSSGGLKEDRAERLAQEGFVTLSLAYFAAESLPSTLNRIPLEYFETAIGYLRRRSEKVGLWGISRGAELSLILGALFPDQIDAIAAHVPSSVVYGALDAEGQPAWTCKGEPFASSAPFVYTPSATGETETSPIAVTPSFLKGMENKVAFAAAAIPVEKIRCPLLMLSGEDDQMWPSSLFAQQIVERLKTHRSPISYTHLSYPGVGHSPSKGAAGLHPIMKRWFSNGGTPMDNALAAVDWWGQTLSFFHHHLHEN